VAGRNGVGADHDRLHAAAADLGDGCAGDGVRYAGAKAGLTRRGLAETGGQDIPHQDLGDIVTFDPCPLQRGSNRSATELRRCEG